MAVSHSVAATSATSQVLDVVRDIHQRNSDIDGKLNSIESRLIQTVRPWTSTEQESTDCWITGD